MNPQQLQLETIASMPHGLKQRLEPIWSSSIEAKEALAKSREVLEEMYYHLKQICGIELNVVEDGLDKLRSAGVIDHDVSPYFHLWWRIACLGSHFQIREGSVDWEKHLEMCRSAIIICMKWYTGKYSCIDSSYASKSVIEDSIRAVIGVEIEHLQDISRNILEVPEDESECLILCGQPWAGKTSLAARMTLNFADKGYIPIIIQGNTVITPLSAEFVDGWAPSHEPRSSRVASNAQKLNELISSQLFYGTSFVIFLDDPFGHRKLLYSNPLTTLALSEWLELALHRQNARSLGSLKIIITTPIRFLEEMLDYATSNLPQNQTMAKNKFLLNASSQIHLSPSVYPLGQLRNIVANCARRHQCNWYQNRDKIELVCDQILESGCGFDSLHLLCRRLKTNTDDDFLAAAEMIQSIKKTNDSILRASPSEHLVLLASLIGESVMTAGREFAFQTQLGFAALMDAIKYDNDYFLECEDNIASEWVIGKQPEDMNDFDYPVLAHPEIRDAVALLAKGACRLHISRGLENLCRLNQEYPGQRFSGWEAIHVLCNMSEFLESSVSELARRVFTPLAQSDTLNVLYAVMYNWPHLANSCLKNNAMGFLRSIPSNYRHLNRPFIWEAVQIWPEIEPEDYEIRALVLEQTCKRDKSDNLVPQYNNETTLAFLAAGLASYDNIRQASRMGCPYSEKYLEVIRPLLLKITNDKSLSLISRRHDGLFKNPGETQGLRDVLSALKQIADRNRSLIGSELYGLLQVARA